MDNPNNNVSDDQHPVIGNGGGMNKEQAVSGMEEKKLDDVKIEDAQEYEVPKEVASHIQIPSQKPDIPPDLEKMGVTHSPLDQTVSSTVTINSQVPLTDDQLNEGLQQPPVNSFRWLAEICLKQLKLAGIHLMKVKGRYIRAPERA
jgi:hypothetical protein